MTADQYRAALATLGLTQNAAGRWLGVSKRTGQKFAADGPTPPAARAIDVLLRMPPTAREVELAHPHPSMT